MSTDRIKGIKWENHDRIQCKKVQSGSKRKMFSIYQLESQRCQYCYEKDQVDAKDPCKKTSIWIFIDMTE
ncbi:unnamed protein product [Caenorhabditis brenneri]